MEKYSDCELWEILNGVSVAMKTRPLNSADNVSMFWYDLYKDIESEIDKRLLANQ